MIDLTKCTILGTVAKTHGVQGQVALRLSTTGFINIKKMEWVFIEQDGLPVPFLISDYYESNRDTLVLTLDGIKTQEEARRLTSATTWITRENLEQIPPDTAPAPSSLIGYAVNDTKLGAIGVLDDILDFDQNPLFKILQDKREILIPIQPEFIVEVNDAQQTITLQTPEGLLDLF